MEETDFYSMFKKICGKKDIETQLDSWSQMLNMINENQIKSHLPMEPITESHLPQITEPITESHLPSITTETELSESHLPSITTETELSESLPQISHTESQLESKKSQLGGSNKPTNLKLYEQVRKMANKKFSSPSGVYRSSWMVREYKKRGGKYSGTKPKSSGIKRWFKEDWIDLKRPIKNSKGKVIGYKKCGRKSSLIKGKYPLCRPSKSVNSKSPRTYQSISKKSLEKAKKQKKGSKSIKFGGKSEEIYSCPICNKVIKNDIEVHINKHNEISRIKNNNKKITQMGGYHSNLRENLIENLKKKYECPICNKLIKGDVQRHINRHKKLEGLKIIIEKPLPVIPITFPERNQSLTNKTLPIFTERNQSLTNKALPEINRPFIQERNQSLPELDSDEESVYSDWGHDESEDEEQKGGRSQFYGKKSKIMIKVPSTVRKAARYAFKLKKLGFKGGLETGWKRAKQLSIANEIPIEDLKYIRAFFARHIYTSYPSYLEWIKSGRSKDNYWHKKRGIIAILIWGGVPAIKWVNSKSNINLLNKHYNKDYRSLRL